MLFPLVALFITMWRFISWFHLRFRRLFFGGGKPLKCVSDSKQSLSRFLSLAPVAASLAIKKKKRENLDFQSELRNSLKPTSIQYCPKEGSCCSCSVADMKGELRIRFVITLISIITAVWMNFKWLARSYLCNHRSYTSTTLWSALGTVALQRRSSSFEGSWRRVSHATTRWWSCSWFKSGEENWN